MISNKKSTVETSSFFISFKSTSRARRASGKKSNAAALMNNKTYMYNLVKYINLTTQVISKPEGTSWKRRRWYGVLSKTDCTILTKNANKLDQSLSSSDDGMTGANARQPEFENIGRVSIWAVKQSIIIYIYAKRIEHHCHELKKPVPVSYWFWDLGLFNAQPDLQ